MLTATSYSDDLNPLYVYEAKMSLLIRMSQSRAGAERLLEARVLPILADCDYLDARPEADHAFLGTSTFTRCHHTTSQYYTAERNTFLPSAVQRYHQLLTPALELVTGIIVTLGHKHVTAANQVYSTHVIYTGSWI